MTAITLRPRQRELLAAIVEAYTRTGGPVGSHRLARQGGFSVSPATIRNEMAELETAGMLFAPHTSAGRVPTEAGYQYYVDHALADCPLSPRERQALESSGDATDGRQRLKAMAKNLAELSDGCVMVGFAARDVYYTGLANLFGQPEFQDYQFSCTMSEVLDHLDEVMEHVYPQFAGNPKVQILIGRRNPFGRACSVVLVGYARAISVPGVLGVLGPLRMNYRRNRSLLVSAQPLLGNNS